MDQGIHDLLAGLDGRRTLRAWTAALVGRHGLDADRFAAAAARAVRQLLEAGFLAAEEGGERVQMTLSAEDRGRRRGSVCAVNYAPARTGAAVSGSWAGTVWMNTSLKGNSYCVPSLSRTRCQ